MKKHEAEAQATPARESLQFKRCPSRRPGSDAHYAQARAMELGNRGGDAIGKDSGKDAAGRLSAAVANGGES